MGSEIRPHMCADYSLGDQKLIITTDIELNIHINSPNSYTYNPSTMHICFITRREFICNNNTTLTGDISVQLVQ